MNNIPHRQKIKYLAEYALFRLVVRIVRSMSIDSAANISAWVWTRIAPRTRRHKRAMDNLALAYPEKSVEEREKIAIAMWDNLGRVMAESFQIDRLLAEEHRLHLKPGLTENIARRYKNKDGAGINVSLHTGNWEVAIWPMLVMNTPPAGVYRQVKNPYVDDYIRKIRENLFPKGMIAKPFGNKEAGMETARFLNKVVAGGGKIGLLADLYDRSGIEIDFFGHPARSTAFPAILARRLGCRLWVGRCIRKGRTSHFELEIREVHVKRTGNQSQDIKDITQDVHNQFESWVREYPEQWMWSNRRWS